MSIDFIQAGTGKAIATTVNCAGQGGYVSPWVDGARAADGTWKLPEYPPEIKGLAPDDPKARPWRPGEYEEGVDNTDMDEEGQIREWGGQKLWSGDRPPRGWDPTKLPENFQALLKVPHMPAQPTKEMFARLKAIEPRAFEDKHFEEVLRNLPAAWPQMLKYARHAESFGVHTEQEPAEWAGQEDELVPAVYPTPRPDTVTICVGVAGHDGKDGPPTIDIPGAEYDYLEFLYAKDQEGKLIQIMDFNPTGYTPSVFYTYSFVPPPGTTSITPFASFKIRGVWRGSPIEWDPKVGSEEMQWFTNMEPEVRALLADKGKLDAQSKAQVAAIKYGKNRKTQPVLWPEDSWEGNCAKARAWDESAS